MRVYCIYCLKETQVTYCTVLCRFTPWPDDALEMVATTLLEETKLEAPLLARCVAACKHFHHSIHALSAK